MNLYDLMLIVPAVLTAYVISYISMPAVIRIAELKDFIDSPDGNRKLHPRIVPTMGGVGIFAAFMISYSIWGQVVSLGAFPFFIAALFMLFLLGIRDDIVELTPFRKFTVQFAAASVLVVGGGVLGWTPSVAVSTWVISGASSPVDSKIVPPAAKARKPHWSSTSLRIELIAAVGKMFCGPRKPSLAST